MARDPARVVRLLAVTRRKRARPDLAALSRPESPEVRALIESLLAERALDRARALDGIGPMLLSARASEAVACLVELATTPGVREASAILVRLFAALASADDPPRAGHPSHLLDAFRAQAAALVRYARVASDPQGARIAACMASRFPELDVEVEPLLVALTSGALDRDEGSRLLYALARIQASRRAPFQRRIADALARASADAETIAVALALAEHDPPEPLRSRLRATLRAAATLPSTPDPRAWGRALSPTAIERGLALLA